MGKALVGKRGYPLQKMSLQRRGELRKRYVAQMPAWKHPVFGFLASFLFVGLAMLISLGMHMLLNQLFVFPGILPLLAVLLVALLWGVGPALFAVVLGAISLDFLFVPPLNKLDLHSPEGIAQVLPFVLAGLVVAILTGQRETARLRALAAEEEAKIHAEELEQLNEELTETNRLKDQFLSMASHELKTPITSIRGQAQIAQKRLAREPTPGLENIKETLQKIDEQTRRLNSLVDDLLDLGSIRAGHVGLQMQPCNLVEICREVIEDQHLLTGRTINLETPADPVMVKGDANRLSQVVINLVSNALKYSPENSPVCVRVSQPGDHAQIEVKNAGKGISPEQQKHIFEPFYRTPDAQGSPQRGMGLGLAICKNLVERHGGRIWCESLPDNGATFMIEVPLR